MATYSVYDNILVRLESVFLEVEMEVDREISVLLAEHKNLNQQLIDIKSKVEILNSLKRSFDLYCDNEDELQGLNNTLFKKICDKQILLRFLQEKELLLNGYLILPESQIPGVIDMNREFRLRKRLQEAELLGSFLLEQPCFEPFISEIEQANEIFDLAIESGATDKLENAVNIFQYIFEKVINIYDFNKDFVGEFKDFKSQILLQANQIPTFNSQNISSVSSLRKVYKAVQEQRINLELELNRLLYQYSVLNHGKKFILNEIKYINGELESIVFKEYSVKQKMQELKQYKTDLNSQKDIFMRDPTVDSYSEAVKQLEFVEHRFKRLMMHRSVEQRNLIRRFFTTNRIKMEDQICAGESPYNKILFQMLHNIHVPSQHKMAILRLSIQSKLVNTHSGKPFYQRRAKTHSFADINHAFEKAQAHELH